ncbi:GSH-induced LITAF domain protein, partial [Linum grandiflorum]
TFLALICFHVNLGSGRLVYPGGAPLILILLPRSCGLHDRTMGQKDEPVVGVPYYSAHNPYQAGLIPPNAIVGDPKGIPIQQTMFHDTPAPINCVYCGSSGVTDVRTFLELATLLDVATFLASNWSKPSLAAVVGCMMPFMLGVCFLCPSMDCLWHKYHYCPSCKEKVGEFEKNDPCLVVDLPQWKQESFALPA